MKTRKFATLFQVLLLALSFALNCALAERNCDDEVLDECAVNLFIYGNPDRRFGTSTIEVATECRYVSTVTPNNPF